MPSPSQSVAGHHYRPLGGTWELCATATNSVETQSNLPANAVWTAVRAPSTVAACLREAGQWSIDSPAAGFDSQDWWFRTRFPSPARTAGEVCVLGFDGLATLAEVWLNGELLLRSDNMFLAHERRIDEQLRADNELVLRFRALDPHLNAKHPRPRWRTPMVAHQQLRTVRTTLLGRTPGWSPPAPPVGPWRAVWLETRSKFSDVSVRLQARVEGTDGIVHARADLRPLGDAKVESAVLTVSRDGKEFRAELGSVDGGRTVAGSLRVPNAKLWWPWTHGEPALYEARLTVRLSLKDEEVEIGLTPIGFRTIELNTDAGDFSVKINGARIFCRGACWTPLDVVSLDASVEAMHAAVAQVRNAGMNMLRVGGMTVYESDEFLDACDRNGILLWQDFMFSNMDYPGEDPAFLTSVSAEARQQLARLAGHACLTVLCGNSEGEQQAAMWGAPRELWAPSLFHETLPAISREICPDVPYWPSSAHGGAFPHQGSSGTTSYYGVGAYLRPLEDARRAEVRFASECLAFANVPDDRALTRMPGGPALRVHHPAWKARTPRDLGAGWDFDDVRDHYLTTIFGVDPLQIRYADPERYFALSRAVTGEVMSSVFAEWRRARSSCRGGLIWFWRDLWAGAGWGVVDDTGAPKAPYYYLKRALQPLSVSISDEGGNGLFVHATNEHGSDEQITLELEMFLGDRSAGKASRSLLLPARGTLELSAIELFPGFMDLSNAYRFGPPSHDLVVVTLRDADGAALAHAFHFDVAASAANRRNPGIEATAVENGPGRYDVQVRTQQFAQTVWIEAEGYLADEGYFHLAPGAVAYVTLRQAGADQPRAFRGRIHALNQRTPARVTLSR